MARVGMRHVGRRCVASECSICHQTLAADTASQTRNDNHVADLVCDSHAMATHDAVMDSNRRQHCACSLFGEPVPSSQLRADSSDKGFVVTIPGIVSAFLQLVNDTANAFVKNARMSSMIVVGVAVLMAAMAFGFAVLYA